MSWVNQAVLALREGKGNVLLHLLKEADGDRLLIGNNVGKTNGWVTRADVLGRLLAVHRD